MKKDLSNQQFGRLTAKEIVGKDKKGVLWRCECECGGEKIVPAAYAQKVIPNPFYIFIFGSKDMVEKEEIMHNLFVNDSSMGVTSLFLFDDMYMLPHDCRCIYKGPITIRTKLYRSW